MTKNKNTIKSQVEEDKEISRLVWKYVDLPSGCSNCWGDLYQGCTDECRASSDRQRKKREALETDIRQALTDHEKEVEERVREEIIKEIDDIWNKYHINNTTDDGFRDSKDVVIEKFASALKEQLSYLQTLTQE